MKRSPAIRLIHGLRADTPTDPPLIRHPLVTPERLHRQALVYLRQSTPYPPPHCTPMLGYVEYVRAELWASLLQAERLTPVSRARKPPRQSMACRSAAGDASTGGGTHIRQRHLTTVRQFCESYPAFTEGSLRWLLFNRSTNGLSAAIIKKGTRSILIDVERFFGWLERRTASQGGTVGPVPTAA